MFHLRDDFVMTEIIYEHFVFRWFFLLVVFMIRWCKDYAFSVTTVNSELFYSKKLFHYCWWFVHTPANDTKCLYVSMHTMLTLIFHWGRQRLETHAIRFGQANLIHLHSYIDSCNFVGWTCFVLTYLSEEDHWLDPWYSWFLILSRQFSFDNKLSRL